MTEVKSIDIKLFNIEDETIKKVKWHCIELDQNFITLKANYLSEEKIEEQWQECWRCWDEVYLKSAVVHYGYARELYEEKEWLWIYTISINGHKDDIFLFFESRDEVKAFHDLFKAYMNA